MCGIAGILNFDRAEPVARPILETMTAALQHRGPDDSGIYAAKNVGLGFRRLAILDLSHAGNQPMTNEDETVWSTTNGEIYNYQDLAANLRRRGHRLRSRSDSEVVVHLYEEYGPEFVRKLRGMFAIALWDTTTQTLMLTRDRVGKKPLCYYSGNTCIAYASELRALVQHPGVSRAINFAAIDRFLSFGYVPAPLTAFADVYKVPPGHYLLCREGRISIQAYWRPEFTPKRTITISEAAEELREILQEAVRIRLLSDVPLGVFLSGGVDSSVVVALMSQATDRINSFSIGFEEESFNELPYARAVAQHFGTNHTEFVVRPDALEVIHALVSHYGEPFADTSCIPTYYVARLARSHVSVVLNGDGGDESFAGYGRMRSRRLINRLFSLPRKQREAVAASARVMANLPGRAGSRAALLAHALTAPLVERYANLVAQSFFPDSERAALYTGDLRPHWNPAAEYLAPIMAQADSDDPMDQVLYTELCSILPGDLLVKMDIATMANGLEARSPFLDHRVIEFAARLPSNFKIRGTEQKYLLKRMCHRLVPETVLNRPKKGFAVPLASWFRGSLGLFARDVLYDRASTQRGYFRPDRVQRLLEDHIAGKADNAYRLWSLLFFELWHRQFLDGVPEPWVDAPSVG